MSVINWYHWYKTTAPLFARSWFICAAVLFVTVMRSGLHYSYGEFLVDLRQDFNGSSMTEGNWIGTLVMTTSMTLAPISVSFIRLFDTRGYEICTFGGLIVCSASCILSSLMTSFHTLVFTYSVLQGLGTSVTYMASSLILVEYFDKAHPYHVLGTSILYCGYPLGSVIFNPIYATLVDSYGWRIAFRIAGVILLITAFITTPIFVSRYNNTEYDAMKQRESKGALLIPLEKVRRPEVILWFTVNLTTFLGFYMPIVNLPTYMRDMGYQGAVTSLAVTVLSFSEIVAYVGASLIGDLLKGRLIIVNLISSMALCAIYFVWPSVDNTGWLMIITMSVGSGFFLGFAIVYTFAETVDITRLPQDQAWGYTNTCSGVGLLLGPLLTGGIYDIRQSHDDVFYVTGGIFLFQLTLYCFLVYFVHLRDVRERLLFDTSALNATSSGGEGPYNDYTQLQGNDDDSFNVDANKQDNHSEAMAIANHDITYGYDQKSPTTGAPQNYYSYYGGIGAANNKDQPQQPVSNTTSQLSTSLDETGQPTTKQVLIAAPAAPGVPNGSNNRRIRLQASNSRQLSTTTSANPTEAGNSVSPASPLTVQAPRMYTIDYQPNDSRLLYDK